MACTLKSLLNSVMSTEDDWRLRLVRQWPLIVGDLHGKMRLEKVAHDTVIIGVYDSHWMQELFMLSRVIIKTINEKLGANYVAKLRFILASAKEIRKKKQSDAPINQKKRSAATMSPAQRKALSSVKDDQLQTILQQFFERCE
jgi:hypothetical protein